MNPKDLAATTAQDAAQRQANESKPTGAFVRLPPGRALCAPPPPLPPGYKPISVPDDWYDQPKVWACRKCCRNFNWTYRPPKEEDLDEPCVRCHEVMEAEERAVEVQRLTLKYLCAGKMPIITQVVTQVAQVESAASVEPHPPEPGSGVACTVDEAGRRLGCKRTTVFQLLKAGRLMAAPKVGRQRMVLVASVDELLAAGGLGAVRDERPARPRTRKARTTNGKVLAAEIAKLPVG